MIDKRINKNIVDISRNKIFPLFLILIYVLLTFLAMIIPVAFRPTPYVLDVGDVAFQDIRAPRSFSFISETLTEIAEEEAERTISPIYLPADPTINREQVENLRIILNYISSIRVDSFATLTQQIDDLLSIQELHLTPQLAEQIIKLDEATWLEIRDESSYVLEEIMRNTIREDQVINAQRNILPLISFNFSDTEAEIIRIIVSPLIKANSIFSNERTSEAIQAAREKIEPVAQSYVAGETIVSSGQVITPVIREALQELGLIQPTNLIVRYISSGFIAIAVISFQVLYVQRIKTTVWNDIPGLILIMVLYLIFLIIAKIIIPTHTILPYLFPIAAFALTVSSLFDYEISVISVLGLSVLIAYGENNALDLSIFYILSSLGAVFSLKRGRRITQFFIAGLVIGLVGSFVILAFRLISSYYDLIGLLTLIGVAFLNGLGSISLTLVLQFVVASILGKTTALQLMDLSRPDHPLLQLILNKAPGTYQHSLQVANLAEQAAKSISADALLTRVGALYHDVGKAVNSLFFIENQPPENTDTHDEIDPVISAATIIQHVDDGMKLAKKYRLPPQIKQFITEHHGGMYTNYQYNKAIEKSKSKDLVDKSLYRYPGPSPQSKETAILMLADGVEARARAEIPKDENDIKRIVNNTIDLCLKEGQLETVALTFQELNTIKESFINTLQNTYHQRIKYPEKKSG